MSRHLTALVIGNAAFKQAGELKNSTNAAEDIAGERIMLPCGWTARMP